MKGVIKKGWVAMNKGEFEDLGNMSFCNSKREAERLWEGQEILEVEIKFKELRE